MKGQKKVKRVLIVIEKKEMLQLFGFGLHLGGYIRIGICGICGIRGLFLSLPPSTFGWIATLKGPFATLTKTLLSM